MDPYIPLTLNGEIRDKFIEKLPHMLLGGEMNRTGDARVSPEFIDVDSHIGLRIPVSESQPSKEPVTMGHLRKHPVRSKRPCPHGNQRRGTLNVHTSEKHQWTT